jgi:hypothetical protein
LALAVRTFREHQWALVPISAFEVEAWSPAVTHAANMRKIEDWLRSAAKPGGSDHEGAVEGDGGALKGRPPRNYGLLGNSKRYPYILGSKSLAP